jgi:NADP-dependent 3-hydroxy acid dehydrogenase YdfG
VNDVGGQNVVITGASAGIGAALAELLGRHGHSVVLVGRRVDALNAAAAASGPRALAVVGDVTSRQQVAGVVEQAIARFGHIDVWINNAGQGITRMPSELTDADLDDMMRVNVKSALYGMQEVLPHFKQRGRGHIINISSMLGRIPFAVQRSAYSGAKHFLNALTAMFRDEVQQAYPGIHFSLVSPGVVRTEFGLRAKGGGVDSRTMPVSQSAEEVAAVIAQVIDSRRPDVYTFTGAHDRVVAYYSNIAGDPEFPN